MSIVFLFRVVNIAIITQLTLSPAVIQLDKINICGL